MNSVKNINKAIEKRKIQFKTQREGYEKIEFLGVE
jgi:hypothetical protein